ncbi:sulfotransferase family 2 domain-containing protein [Evansella sp. AB-rgal1]|uniref:sulfotransferase family 2 domain-containing protein n=1 Tax=Evansella sp. AB-rgal1 TaxID=3242696 RepID=UPI00359ED42D
MNKNQILVHLHMPKTGGTSLKNIIKKNIDPHRNLDVYVEHEKRERIMRTIHSNQFDCIQGHFPYGIHKYIPCPFTYITMLRDPIDRIVSEYYFIKNNKKHELHHVVQHLSLEEYQNQPQNRNLQTRLISGHMSDPLTIADVNKAKENIEKHFSVVGITEMFDESLLLMEKKFGWKNVKNRKQNATKKRPALTSLSPKTLTLIKRNNNLDNILYQFAKRDLLVKLKYLHSNSKTRVSTSPHKINKNRNG